MRAAAGSADFCFNFTDTAEPYYHRDHEFEWDDRKAAFNLAWHGVSFDHARVVFSDPFAVAREDQREGYDERRCIVLGMAGSSLLHVAYARRGERIRISARRAEPRERRRYHEGND